MKNKIILGVATLVFVAIVGFNISLGLKIKDVKIYH